MSMSRASVSRESLRSPHERLPVGRALHGGVGLTIQHTRAHVGENDPSAVEALTILAQRPVVEVILDLPVEEIRLADEEIGAPGGIQQALGPFGVARVGDHLPAAL